MDHPVQITHCVLQNEDPQHRPVHVREVQLRELGAERAEAPHQDGARRTDPPVFHVRLQNKG